MLPEKELDEVYDCLKQLIIDADRNPRIAREAGLRAKTIINGITRTPFGPHWPWEQSVETSSEIYARGFNDALKIFMKGKTTLDNSGQDDGR
jgi:hypothetical protein